MTRSSVLLALLTAAACSKSSPARPAAPVANTAPPTATCGDAAAGYARARAGDHPGADAPTLTERVAAACQAAAWSDDARACYADAAAPIEGQPAPDDCGVHLTQVQRDQLEERLADLAPRTVTATSETAARLATARTGVPACDAYLQLLAGLTACDKFPQQARDAMVQGGLAMLDAFGQLSTADASARQAAGDACTQGADGLRQAASSMGCPLAP